MSPSCNTWIFHLISCSLAGDYEVQGRPVTFTPGDRAESVRFVTFADTVKELNETVSLMLQVVDAGGIDVELCPQSTTVVTIFDDNGKCGKPGIHYTLYCRRETLCVCVCVGGCVCVCVCVCVLLLGMVLTCTIFLVEGMLHGNYVLICIHTVCTYLELFLLFITVKQV